MQHGQNAAYCRQNLDTTAPQILFWYVIRPPEMFGHPMFCDLCGLPNKSGFCRRHLVLYNVGSAGQFWTGWLVKPVTATPFFCLLRIYNYSGIHICSLNCHYKQLKPASVIFVHGTSILRERERVHMFENSGPIRSRTQFQPSIYSTPLSRGFVSRITESSFWRRDPVGGAHCRQGVFSPLFLFVYQFLNIRLKAASYNITERPT